MSSVASLCSRKDLNQRSIFYTNVRIKNLTRSFSLSEQKREGCLIRVLFPLKVRITLQSEQLLHLIFLAFPSLVFFAFQIFAF